MVLQSQSQGGRNKEEPVSPAPALQTQEVTYFGRWDASGQAEVWCEDRNTAVSGSIDASAPSRRELPMCLNIRSHSPTGFAWGYGDSGPAQLALALLVDALGDPELAQKHYQDFKFNEVAGWGESWTITAREIREFVARRETA